MTLTEYLATPISKGERNASLFRACMMARREGWSEAEIVNRLGAKARADGLNPSEIRATIRSSLHRDPGTPTARGNGGRNRERMDWDSYIGGGRVVSETYRDPNELKPSENWRRADLERYLRAVFREGEIISYNCSARVVDGRVVPVGKGVYVQSREDLIASPPEAGPHGAWIRFNPMDGRGCTDTNVAEFRHALVESDKLPIENQLSIIRSLRLPCSAIVHSGGRSLHAIVRIDAGADRAEFDKRVKYLYDTLERNGFPVDRVSKNPSRLSRMPGVERDGNPQFVIDVQTGCASWADWHAHSSAVHEHPQIQNMRDLALNPPPLSAEIVQGILRAGHKMLFSAPSKSGKSFLMINLAFCLTRGGRWIGYPCAEGRVLYINLEVDPGSFWQRLQDVKKRVVVNQANLDIWNLRGTTARLDRLTQWLIKHAADKNYIAIIVDPLYKTITGDENNAREMADFLHHLDVIAQHSGAAVIAVHHFSKGKQGAKDPMDRPSGSGVFARDPDATGTMTPLEGDDVRGFRLEWTLREFAEPAPVELVYEWPIHTVRQLSRRLVGSPGRRPKITDEDLVAAVEILSDGRPVAVDAIADYLGVSSKTVRRIAAKSQLLQLVEDGLRAV